MKHLIFILSFILSFNLSAQDKRFTTLVYSEPYAYKDGFNIGLGVEYQMTTMYFKAQSFGFPNLNGIDYMDFYGSFGLNQHIGLKEKVRLYQGFKLGFILRNNVYPTVGAEIGIDYYFRNFGLGLEFGVNYLDDMYKKTFGHSDNYDPFGRLKIIL